MFKKPAVWYTKKALELNDRLASHLKTCGKCKAGPLCSLARSISDRAWEAEGRALD